MSTAAPSAPSDSTARLASLDALRGFDMFWIIGGAVVARALVKAADNESLAWISEQLEHVPWEGFRFAGVGKYAQYGCLVVRCHGPAL